PTMGYCFIPEIMGRVSTLKNEVPIEWKESGSNNLEQLLRSGKIDIAFIPSNFIQMDNLEYRKFRDVEEILYVAKDHPLANEKS
ncbi:LysR family transcriptional regulator substrate-binding protein, partial [Acinetobacter baumannii]|uniref:LysR family transcriptional regulator substrate-binding protein n=1 Tax=Acinetobacter baumannii TaxID=470 RepID=UPI003321B932